MKKLIALVLALVLCLALAACGPDKQPAIDAFNKASRAFDEVAVVINADPGAFDDEVVSTMVEMAELLQEHKALLEGNDEISQDKLDEMIEWYGEVEEWVDAVKTDLGLQ